jgi:hypothetical protein
MWENIQSIAQSWLSNANVDETKPVSAVRVALRNNVRVVVTHGPIPGGGPSFKDWDVDRWRINLRPCLPEALKQEAAGHESGEIVCDIADYRGSDRELICDAFGACIQMPTLALSRELQGGEPWDKLDHTAEYFGVTLKAAFLRICLFLEEPAALIDNSKILVVGGWGDATESDLRNATQEEVEGVQRYLIERARRPIYILTHRNG